MPQSPTEFAASFTPFLVGDRGGDPDFMNLGALAVSEASGRLVAWAGDPRLPAYLRSSAKPFQAVAFLRRGLDRRLALSHAEVACACASHSGEVEHVEAARRILDAAAVPEGALLCGTHPAFSDKGRRPHGPPQPIHNNCSGKHAAMLSVCQAEGWDATTYPEADHPLQRENLATLAAFAGVEPGSIAVARDNCTVPTFALPLAAAARAFARLLEPEGLDAELAEAGLAAAKAMTLEPFFVGGTARLDTAIMKVTQGRLLVKTGANGYYGGAQRASRTLAAQGFALKLASAEGEGAKAAVVVETLAALSLLTPEEAEELRSRFALRLSSCRGHVVGGARFVAELRRA